MKKISLVMLLLTLLCTACALEYHSQLHKPVYYLKAHVIEIKPDKKTPDNDQIQINFFGLTSNISSNWFDNKKEKNAALAYQLQNKLRFLISYDQMGKMGCDKPGDDNERDFCDAFESPQEYYDKIWTLTADDLEKPQYATRGNYMVVQQKEMWFANPDVTAVYKYRGNNFVAYRRDFKSGGGNKAMKSELIIFHQKTAPDAIGIGTLIDNNDELFDQLLSTIE
jgi:hypothetical protein